MKAVIIARPDHSLYLFRQINDLKISNVDVRLVTFSALRENSIESVIFPKLKRAPSNSITLNLYTIVTRLLTIIYRKFGLNHIKMCRDLFSFFFDRNLISDAEIIHYWPFYAIRIIENIDRNKIKTVAEFYEAEPDFVNDIFEEEYKKYKLNIERKINKMIDQNECFSFEDNFIVASEYTKRSYENKYPDKNFFICRYGPLGMKLSDSSKIQKSKNGKKIVFVGQICLEKGVQYLIEAVKDTEYTLDLIGPIRCEQIELFNNLLKNKSNINCLGPMRNSEVLNIIPEYNLFCLPSLSDNYSIAVVEALSCRIPVIVTENCGNADDILSFNLGFVVPIKCSSALSAAINKFQNEFNYEKFESGLNQFFSEENASIYPRSVIDVYFKISGKFQ